MLACNGSEVLQRVTVTMQVMSWSSSREKAEDLLPPPAAPAAAWGGVDASGSEAGGAAASDNSYSLGRTYSSATVDETGSNTGTGQSFWSEGLSVSATPFLLLMMALVVVVSPPRHLSVFPFCLECVWREKGGKTDAPPRRYLHRIYIETSMSVSEARAQKCFALL